MVVRTMPITLTADKADEIPEPLRATAKEENGKFVLPAIPDGWGLANEAATRAKVTKLEQDAKRAAERMKAFAKNEKGDIYEPEEFAALLAKHKQLEEAQGKAPTEAELRKSIVTETEGRYSKQLADAEKRATDLDRELDRALLDGTIDNLLSQMRPREGKADLIKLLLREQLGLDKSDGKRVVRVKDPANPGDWLAGGNSADGYLSAKDYALNSMRSKPGLSDMFEGDGAGGAGATSTGTGGGRRSKYTFPASRLQTNAAEYLALEKRAAADGLKVEILPNA